MAKKRTRKLATTRKALNSDSGKKSSVKKNPDISMPKSKDVNFRVYPIDDLLREAMAEVRGAQGFTVQNLIRASLEDQLPIIVDQLHSMGLAHESSMKRPARWPLDSASLAALSLASAQTVVSQKDLLIACLRKYCSR